MHLAAGVFFYTTCWMNTHAANRHARTGGPDAEAAGADLTLMFDGGNIFATADTLHDAYEIGDNGFGKACILGAVDVSVVE